MPRKSRSTPPRNTSLSRSTRGRAESHFKRKILRVAHVMWPTLAALAFAGAANIARAQGTISFSGAQTFMQTVQTFAEYAGAVICLIGLIFAGVSFMSGNIQRGVIGLFGAIFGAGVLGWGAGWISHGRQILICLSRHPGHPARVRAASAGRR